MIRFFNGTRILRCDCQRINTDYILRAVIWCAPLNLRARLISKRAASLALFEKSRVQTSRESRDRSSGIIGGVLFTVLRGA